MKNKETKTESIKIRIAPTDKKMIDDYCAKNGYQVSDFIRTNILKLIKEN